MTSKNLIYRWNDLKTLHTVTQLTDISSGLQIVFPAIWYLDAIHTYRIHSTNRITLFPQSNLIKTSPIFDWKVAMYQTDEKEEQI